MYQLPPRSHIASFDVDAQKTFTPLCPEELPVPDGNTIVEELNKQAHCASVRLGSKDSHSPHALWVATKNHPPLEKIAGRNMDVRWPEHAVPGTLGFELLEGLPAVDAYDYFVWKGMELDMHPYGACYHDLREKLSTGVIEFLHSKNITTILVGGLATEYCVKNTAVQLQNATFQVVVNLAACRGIDVMKIQQAIDVMKSVGVAFVNSVNELRGEN